MKPAPVNVWRDLVTGAWYREVRAAGRWYLVGTYGTEAAARQGGRP